eukprot:13368935-Ditylum_brightwellii.AAC.1
MAINPFDPSSILGTGQSGGRQYRYSAAYLEICTFWVSWCVVTKGYVKTAQIIGSATYVARLASVSCSACRSHAAGLMRGLLVENTEIFSSRFHGHWDIFPGGNLPMGDHTCSVVPWMLQTHPRSTSTQITGSYIQQTCP